MKKGLFVLFVCNLLTFGQRSYRDFQYRNVRSPFAGLGGLMTFLPFVVIIVVFLIVVSASKGKNEAKIWPIN